ncbi:MAG: glycoside hydrolase family 127 protein [Akkermansiaceae bacterium]|nr:glycoside hydrolase family 127 protein [Akkermansiaceae bacterium]MCP5544044.1 glycoside hydrolase family 127 protein [Akkermansiaceae bacterium]
MIPLRFLAILPVLTMTTGTLRAEEGDQFLDGIGETALISRYVFDGDLDDWSRNSLDAAAEGDGHTFVDDETFGKVLSLPGGAEGAFVSVPTSAIGDAVSFSVTGWVKVRQETPGQYFFDLGTDKDHHIGLVPMGPEREGGCGIRLASGGAEGEQGPSSFRVRADEWVHLAAVLDAAKKSLSLYVDGARVGRSEGIRTSISSLIGNAENTRLYLGRPVADGGPRLGGHLHDVRFYRSALSDRQIAVIHHNAISDDKITAEGDTRQESYREDRARLLHGGLKGVADIEVETEVGHLPHLPHEVAGVYQNGSGPKVRVIWPSPTDNKSVAKPGSHVVTGRIPGTDLEAKATVKVVESGGAENAPKHELTSFPLGQVVLNPDIDGKPTPFIRHRDKFLEGLAASDPDRFLWVFRDAFGKKQPDRVKPLGVWDSPTTRLRGHASGHYLTALAQAYASTSYDPELQAEFGKKMEDMIDVLHELSQIAGKPAKEGGPSVSDPTKVPPGPGKDGYDSDLSGEGIRTDSWNWGKGFISGYPPDQFIMLEHGATYGGGNNQIWAPYYTLHKILAGLVDCYEVGGNPKALEVARDMGLWVYERLKVLPQETLNKMWGSYIAGEYGGMNEILARLHRVTGDERFLEAAKLFDNTRFFFGDAGHSHGLAKNVDTIRGLHANQHIPQILGALETYRNNHELPYFDVAENFWDLCEHGYMYSIGGVAGARNPNNAECFTAEPNSLFHNGLSEGGQNETCATYNLLKLGRELFLFEREAKFMDYYERAIYNHILASVDEDTPANTYHVPLNPGAKKSFGNPHMDGFTCCNGTAIESGTKLQDSIYFKAADNSALYVNLFVPSTLDWKEKGVKITQATSFPFADTSTLTIEGGGGFPIHIRVPEWTSKEFGIRINGDEQKVDASPGNYATLDRNWRNGDKIEVRIPMSFHLMPLMDQPNVASIFYGPVLLAAEEPEARSSWRGVTLDMDDPAKSITGDPATLHFQVGDTKLKPFFEFCDGFHSVYLEIQPTN